LKEFFTPAMLADIHSTFKKMSDDAQKSAKLFATRGGIV